MERWVSRQRLHAHAPEGAPARSWQLLSSARFPSHWCHGVVRHLGGRAVTVSHRSIRGQLDSSPSTQARRYPQRQPKAPSCLATLMAPDLFLPSYTPSPTSCWRVARPDPWPPVRVRVRAGVHCSIGAAATWRILRARVTFTRALASAAGLTVAQLKETAGHAVTRL